MQEITTVRQSEQYLMKAIEMSFKALYGEAQAHLLNVLSAPGSVSMESFDGARQTRHLMETILKSVDTLPEQQRASALEMLRASATEGSDAIALHTHSMPRPPLA